MHPPPPCNNDGNNADADAFIVDTRMRTLTTHPAVRSFHTPTRRTTRHIASANEQEGRRRTAKGWDSPTHSLVRGEMRRGADARGEENDGDGDGGGRGDGEQWRCRRRGRGQRRGQQRRRRGGLERGREERRKEDE
ncbi:hypothetical protein BDW22DRAFT_647625 [Trametopsis cervina]|nr:hypothetical protein BDW22DRAFT_647625 [Trametopsis cervina]